MGPTSKGRDEMGPILLWGTEGEERRERGQKEEGKGNAIPPSRTVKLSRKKLAHNVSYSTEICIETLLWV